MREELGHPRLGFGEWREAIAPIFDVRPLGPGRDAGFHAELTRHNLGTALVGSVATSAQRYERSESLIGAVGVDHVLIQLYEAGQTTLDLDEGEAHAGPGDILILDLSRPVHSHASDMRALNLVLPRNLLPLDADALDELHGTVLPARDPRGRLAGDHLRSLSNAAPALDQATATELAQASAHLLSACLSASLRREQDAPATLTATLTTICRFIDRQICDPELDATMLCGTFGLSRSALYRLFAPMGGVSEHIRRRRLARARLALNASALERGGIGKLARRFGFSSDDVFSRAFKAQFGVSPREAAQMRGLAPIDHADDSLTTWLRHLTG